MNKSLLDTDIFSEVSKGNDPSVTRNATAYRRAFGRITGTLRNSPHVTRRSHGECDTAFRTDPFDEQAAGQTGAQLSPL